MTISLSQIDNSWTLFLDRDGVINHDVTPYTLNKGYFRFYDGTLAAMKIFNALFHRVIVVTNQRGVGRKLMSESDLAEIHEYMATEVKSAGGRIDAIFYCTSTENDHPDRKPNPGMAFTAMKQFPEIQRDRAIMVGNNISDMQFGKNAGFYTVLVNTTGVRVELPHPLVDFQFEDLHAFARALPTAS